jgi:hypothetical protein
VSLSANTLPTILSVTLSYLSPDPLSPTELLSLYLTLPEIFSIEDLFDLTEHETEVGKQKEGDKKAA